ncbi:MAG: 1-acyl-sn-glycerol-3-phosphate acyltransferase [Anaerolineae bacterium]|nr:1-acyl-sn-glycerol-3-phosphate acyltransferase [Anaerolineae bacterium]
MKLSLPPIPPEPPSLRARLVNAVLRFLTAVLCRIDQEQLCKVPRRGPLILIGNHVNFLEVPLLIARLQDRPVTGFSKVETWHNPFKRFLFNTWRGIPIHRGEVDNTAFQLALETIKAGYIFAIAPEGTRSYTGKLQKGLPGVVLLALRSGAPLLPVAYHGGEKFWENLKRLKRTDFHIAVGNPFYVKADGVTLSRDVRQQITDEIMYQIAALLPPQYRGVYADLSNATQEYLYFEPGVESNLKNSQ